MFFRLFTTLCVLLLSFQAIGATIGVRSTWISGPGNALEATTTETIVQPQPIHDAEPGAALSARSEDENYDANTETHETTVDWREDGSEALRLEAEREAGFLPSSFHESGDPSPQFWPLFKICIFSAIAICILKIVRDLKR